MVSKLHYTELYPGDMTLWMFEEHSRYDYHLLQFIKRFELQSENSKHKLVSKEEDKSKVLAFT